MPASSDQRLDMAIESVGASGAITNATATGLFAATAGITWMCYGFLITASANPAAAVRATLAFTRGGTTLTVGFQLPAAAFPPMIVNFGTHPIVGDVGTEIRLTVPALGAGVVGECLLLGGQA